jgi:predicted XRE-type DNA-binding protein
MGTKVLESKEVKEAIAKALVGGQSQKVIAQSLGVSQPTISRLVNEGDVKALVERECLNLLEVLPDAVGNLRDLVREMKGDEGYTQEGNQKAGALV